MGYQLVTFVFAVCFSLTTAGTAQSVANGYWQGTITQEEGGYRSDYGMKLFLQIDEDGKVSGHSIVEVDEIYAKMEVRGQLTGDFYLYLYEPHILKERTDPGMEWCLKKLNLIYKKEAGREWLTGSWRGRTTFSNCIPGDVRLERYIPRA